ncbi:MAG: MBL fold metallo-hydrolase [Coriobacteriia bacterium]
MRLTVLGSAASYADARRACAGYLVHADGTNVMLDCGNGTLANLGAVIDPVALDAVFVSHEHPDHFADVYALQAALRYAPAGPAPALPLYLPPGLAERIACLLTEHGREEWAAAFIVHELTDGVAIHIGALTVTPRLVDHTERTFALVVSHDGARLCYTADTALGGPARAAARGADVLLAEATLPVEYAGRAAHMTPAEAGELAESSGARTLMLTHLWPTIDRSAAAREAQARYSGRVIVAEELMAIDVESHGSG